MYVYTGFVANAKWCTPDKYSYGDKSVIRIVNEGETVELYLYENSKRTRHIYRDCSRDAMFCYRDDDNAFCGPDEEDIDQAIGNFLGVDIDDSHCDELACSECPSRDNCDVIECENDDDDEYDEDDEDDEEE